MNKKNGNDSSEQPLIVFCFSLDPVTHRASVTGNIPVQQALQILQDLVITQAVAAALESKKVAKDA